MTLTWCVCVCVCHTCPGWCHRRLPPGRCRCPSNTETQRTPLLTSTVVHSLSVRLSTCMGLLSSGQLSQASPTPSLSLSVCIGFGTFGQLSRTFGIPEHTHTHTHVCDAVTMTTKVEAACVTVLRLYRLRPRPGRRRLLSRCHRCPSGRCWTRWDSCRRRPRRSRCPSSAGLCWGRADSCPDAQRTQEVT